MTRKFTAILAQATATFVLAQCIIGTAAAANAYSVTLHCDQLVPLDPAALPTIYSWSLRLVSSSQRNSGAPDWEAPLPEVEQEYRDALAGDYLRIDLPSLATIKTMGGVVHVRAIVESLDPLSQNWRSKYPDHFEDSLFTIDAGGVVVGHALYSGFDVFALNRAIERSLADRNTCKRAKGLFVQDSQLPPFLRDFLRQNGLQDLR